MAQHTDIKFFLQLEEHLLPFNAINDISKAAELLHEDFAEFGSSGKVYDRQAVMDSYKRADSVNISITNFSAIELSSGIVLCRYIAEKHEEINKSAAGKTLRSSLWTLTDNGWKLYFHQGTAI